MNDDIKEILEKLKENISIVSVEEEHLLLDYITNLQQENEKIREMNMHEHKYGSDMEEKYLIEKTKNDRAVEYIKINFVEDIITVKTLLNILNGRSDE